MIVRRDVILRRYLKNLSPIGEMKTTESGQLCGTDLARYAHVFDDASFKYGAKVFTGARFAPSGDATVRADADGTVCVTIPHHAQDGGVADGDASRYVVVDVANGQATGVLRAHLYDLGPNKGFTLVGIERPDGDGPPG